MAYPVGKTFQLLLLYSVRTSILCSLQHFYFFSENTHKNIRNSCSAAWTTSDIQKGLMVDHTVAV